jgi:hypothetical protein
MMMIEAVVSVVTPLIQPCHTATVNVERCAKPVHDAKPDGG